MTDDDSRSPVQVVFDGFASGAMASVGTVSGFVEKARQGALEAVRQEAHRGGYSIEAAAVDRGTSKRTVIRGSAPHRRRLLRAGANRLLELLQTLGAMTHEEAVKRLEDLNDPAWATAKLNQISAFDMEEWLRSEGLIERVVRGGGQLPAHLVATCKDSFTIVTTPEDALEELQRHVEDAAQIATRSALILGGDRYRSEMAAFRKRRDAVGPSEGCGHPKPRSNRVICVRLAVPVGSDPHEVNESFHMALFHLAEEWEAKLQGQEGIRVTLVLMLGHQVNPEE